MSIVGLPLGITASGAVEVAAGRTAYNLTALGNAQIDTAVKQFGSSSLELDGTGDAATTGTSTDTGNDFYHMGGPWTFEFWFRPVTDTGDASAYLLTDRSAGYSTRNFQLIYRNFDRKVQMGWIASNGSDPSQTLGGGSPLSAAVTLDTWNHVAMVYDGTETSTYLNGTRFQNNTMTYSNLEINATGQFGIGGDIDNAALPFNQGGTGYIDEVRISSTARYDPSSSSFTVPTSAFTDDDDTLALYHFEGSNGNTSGTGFADDTAGRSAETLVANGNAQIDTAQKKFGSSSVDFDGSNSFLSNNSNWDPTTNWTIEFFMRSDVLSGKFGALFYFGNQNTSKGWAIEENGNTGGISLITSNDGSSGMSVRLSGTITASTQHHVAIVLQGTSGEMFIDGTSVSTGTVDPIAGDASSVFRIGGGQGGLSSGNFGGNTSVTWYSGHLDEVRISNTARYTTGFTAPSSAFTNDENTLALWHFEGSDGATTGAGFEDDIT